MPLPTSSGNSAKDIALTVDGDLVLDDTGDFATINGVAVLQQEVLFRLRTTLGDYLYQMQCGTELSSLIGKPNSQETANKGEETIRRSLTHDGLLDDSTLEIISFPLNNSTISYVLLIDASSYGFTEQDVISLEFSVDLEQGLLL